MEGWVKVCIVLLFLVWYCHASQLSVREAMCICQSARSYQRM